MKKTAFIFAVSVISVLVSSCFLSQKQVSILFYDTDQQDFYRSYFQLEKIKYIEDGMYTKVPFNTSLIKNMLVVEKLKIDITRDNIANAATARTADGGPFRRQYLSITEDGITVEKDTEAESTFRYDPIHPDAILEGNRKGFVEYPNVDLFSEYNNLDSSILLFNGIVDYIQRNNIGIIVDKIPAISLEERTHYGTVKNMGEVYFRLKTEELFLKP